MMRLAAISRSLGDEWMPGIASNIPDYPAGVAESMIKNDFAWASENRARILAEWARRYDGKAAKKN